MWWPLIVFSRQQLEESKLPCRHCRQPAHAPLTFHCVFSKKSIDCLWTCNIQVPCVNLTGSKHDLLTMHFAGVQGSSGFRFTDSVVINWQRQSRGLETCSLYALIVWTKTIALWLKVWTGAEDLDLVPFWVSFLKTLQASKQIKSKDTFVFHVSLRHPCRFHEHVASCRPQQNMIDGMHRCIAVCCLESSCMFLTIVVLGVGAPHLRRGLCFWKCCYILTWFAICKKKLFWGGLGCQDIRPVFWHRSQLRLFLVFCHYCVY